MTKRELVNLIAEKLDRPVDKLGHSYSLECTAGEAIAISLAMRAIGGDGWAITAILSALESYDSALDERWRSEY